MWRPGYGGPRSAGRPARPGFPPQGPTGRGLRFARSHDRRPAALNDGGEDHLRPPPRAIWQPSAEPGVLLAPRRTLARRRPLPAEDRVSARPAARIGAASRSCQPSRPRRRSGGREITAVKGLGRWSADMFLIFHLRRPDVLPVGDLGVGVRSSGPTGCRGARRRRTARARRALASARTLAMPLPLGVALVRRVACVGNRPGPTVAPHRPCT